MPPPTRESMNCVFAYKSGGLSLPLLAKAGGIRFLCAICTKSNPKFCANCEWTKSQYCDIIISQSRGMRDNRSQLKRRPQGTASAERVVVLEKKKMKKFLKTP